MAASPVPEEQVAFYKASELIYNVPVDDDNVPFDPTTTVQRVNAPPVRVPCSVEYIDAEGQPVPFGTVTASRIKCSLLDEDYVRVKDCAYVVIGGEKYLYRRTEPPSGLFDVGLYVMHFRAENEL
jgi:hypothetical protein